MEEKHNGAKQKRGDRSEHENMTHNGETSRGGMFITDPNSFTHNGVEHDGVRNNGVGYDGLGYNGVGNNGVGNN